MNFSESFLKSLPEGTTAADVRLIRCAATIQPVDTLEPEELAVLASFEQAKPDPVNASGKPTIMRVVAWMAHEGVNRNRQMFVKQELEQAAQALFKSPHFGVLDFNHSAVLPFSEDPKVIGLWYKADFAFNSKAGKWGILATGMIWSWLFPEHADLLLAEQERRKKISFSMAAIPTSIEFAEVDGLQVEILHNPVFFTVSALDVPPADPAASGLGSEDDDEEEDQLLKRLLTLAQWTSAAHSELPKQGDIMEPNEILQQLAEARSTAEQAIKDLESAFATEKTELVAQVAQLAAQVDELKTKLSELETVRDALAAEHEASLQRLTEQEAELASLRSFKAEADTKDVAAAQAAQLAARIADLPESVRLIHAGRDEETRSRVEAKWVAMDDDQWATYVKDDLLPFTSSNMRLSFLDRSRRFGNIPNIAIESDSKGDISTRVKSLLRHQS